MAKWYGVIGFSETADTGDGIWVEQIVEKNYYGDIYSTESRWESRENSSDDRIDDINIRNQISILADPYLCHNFSTIKFIEFMGVKYKVESVKVVYPRLTISIGGIYNGESQTA